MNKVSLITEGVWDELTSAVSKTKSRSVVAVAYFGQKGASMLPLKKNSVLVVDASEKALKTGQTCPDELLKLYYQGVHIYSKENLHAKLFVIGRSLYCGSANVSGNSKNNLKEVLLKTSDSTAVSEAKAFIQSLCRLELGEDEIQRMNKLYNPPKHSGPRSGKSSGKGSAFYVANLKLSKWTEEEEEEAAKGRKAAKVKSSKKPRHRLDEFIWTGKVPYKKGDNVIQIVKEEKETFVSPIGRLVHVRKWSNGKRVKHFCYVEVPMKRRKNITYLEKKLDKEDIKALKRSGKKRVELERRIQQLWG